MAVRTGPSRGRKHETQSPGQEPGPKAIISGAMCWALCRGMGLLHQRQGGAQGSMGKTRLHLSNGGSLDSSKEGMVFEDGQGLKMVRERIS